MDKGADVSDARDKDVWPFDAWLKLAVSVYHISPHAFWQMSVRDWLALTRSDKIPAMDAAELIKLQKQYPDRSSSDEIFHEPD